MLRNPKYSPVIDPAHLVGLAAVRTAQQHLQAAVVGEELVVQHINDFLLYLLIKYIVKCVDFYGFRKDICVFFSDIRYRI